MIEILASSSTGCTSSKMANQFPGHFRLDFFCAFNCNRYNKYVVCTGGAAMLELLSEPLYILAQVKISARETSPPIQVTKMKTHPESFLCYSTK